VIELCSGLAAELRAGTPPSRAMHRVTAEVPGCADAAGAEAQLGGDVAAALRGLAERPGAAGLRQLAACWELSRRTGAPLAPMCEGVASSLRTDEAVRAEVTAQLASARASARLMGALPLLALLFGSAVGADPLGFLIGTSYGLACLVAGGLLTALGVVWVERLARAVDGDL
jgi:tight adherence protein B